MLYFLNDVEEGGETAFPIADNVTVDSRVRVRDLQNISNNVC